MAVANILYIDSNDLCLEKVEKYFSRYKIAELTATPNILVAKALLLVPYFELVITETFNGEFLDLLHRNFKRSYGRLVVFSDDEEYKLRAPDISFYPKRPLIKNLERILVDSGFGVKHE